MACHSCAQSGVKVHTKIGYGKIFFSMSEKSRIFALDFSKGKHMSDQQIIDSIRNAVRQLAPPHSRAILYGSRARGDARRDSDWDILWILDKDVLTQSDYDTVGYPLVLLGCEMDEEINPILYTAGEWQRFRTTPFYENVVTDGVNLLAS